MDIAQISLLLVVAALMGFAAKTVKQPILVGYLLAGIFLSVLGFTPGGAELEALGKIGVTLLLFLVGLEMNIADLPTFGRVAIITGLSQISFTAIVGFVLALLLGFSLLPAAYIAIALTFSSTIIVIKLLSEKNDLASLYGKICLGILLVQDLVAMGVLIFLSGLKSGGEGAGAVGYLFLGVKAVGLFIAVWFLAKKVMPKVFEKFVSGSPELLFITSLAWALGFASLVAGPLGFTLEIGGFMAGLALSNLPEHLQIASKTRPLRDFFLTIFFLFLGTSLVVPDLGRVLVPTIVLVLFVLVADPLIIWLILGFLGYKKRTTFLTGITLAQISEFSFILIAMGASLGHLTGDVVTIVLLVGVVTMICSTYLINSADKLYLALRNFLTVFERAKTREQALLQVRNISDHVVLVGCDKSGWVLARFLIKKKYPLLVVDFNPKVATMLTAENVPVIFGDITDPEILEATNMVRAVAVVSTVTNLADNLVLLEYIKGLPRRPITIVTATEKEHAVKLYEAGASYVVVPQAVAGEFIRHLLRTYGPNSTRIKRIGKNHFNRLISP